MEEARELHLLKLVGDHGEGFEDGVGRPRDGDDALRTVALRDVDASAALWKETRRRASGRMRRPEGGALTFDLRLHASSSQFLLSERREHE